MALTTLFTIGHSDRALSRLLAVLGEVHLTALVDIRAWPRSQCYPHFDADRLRAAAEAEGMTYHWAGRNLGGMRTPRPRSRHTALQDDGLRGYADHMESDEFQAAATQLIALARRGPLAVLCAEREPDRCHRSLLADYLTLKGVHVVHLLDLGERRDHMLAPELRRETDQPVYDRHQSGRLDLE